jgi:hypothetical protein
MQYEVTTITEKQRIESNDLDIDGDTNCSTKAEPLRVFYRVC